MTIKILPGSFGVDSEMGCSLEVFTVVVLVSVVDGTVTVSGSKETEQKTTDN